MITDGILYLIYGLVNVLISPIKALSDVTFSSSLNTSITTANGYLSSFNAFIPMDTLAQILTLFLAIEGAILTYKLIMWVIKRIPTQN